MTVRSIAAAALLLSSAAAADDQRAYTDKNGASYSILEQRSFTDTLQAAMVEIENDGSVILMEMALDCPGEQYGYLGMVFDLEIDADRAPDIARVKGYSDSLRTDRIGGISLTELDANLENESVVTLFDMGCGRQ